MVVVARGGFVLVAELVGYLVGGGDARDVGVGLLDDSAVLHVDAADGGEGACGEAVVGDELGDDGHFGSGVDGRAGAVLRGSVSVENFMMGFSRGSYIGTVSPSVWVEIATVFIAVARVALRPRTASRV